ncbi:hypothetical protein OF83DRAFT_785086 [Amylostereum chailletii]|nr:hypothetical protein OF83DRAFT_785086 [Amylostereum chailletii]
MPCFRLTNLNLVRFLCLSVRMHTGPLTAECLYTLMMELKNQHTRVQEFKLPIDTGSIHSWVFGRGFSRIRKSSPTPVNWTEGMFFLVKSLIPPEGWNRYVSPRDDRGEFCIKYEDDNRAYLRFPRDTPTEVELQPSHRALFGSARFEYDFALAYAHYLRVLQSETSIKTTSFYIRLLPSSLVDSGIDGVTSLLSFGRRCPFTRPGGVHFSLPLKIQRTSDRQFRRWDVLMTSISVLQGSRVLLLGPINTAKTDKLGREIPLRTTIDTGCTSTLLPEDIVQRLKAFYMPSSREEISFMVKANTRWEDVDVVFEFKTLDEKKELVRCPSKDFFTTESPSFEVKSSDWLDCPIEVLRGGHARTAILGTNFMRTAIVYFSNPEEPGKQPFVQIAGQFKPEEFQLLPQLNTHGIDTRTAIVEPHTTLQHQAGPSQDRGRASSRAPHHTDPSYQAPVRSRSYNNRPATADQPVGRGASVTRQRVPSQQPVVPPPQHGRSQSQHRPDHPTVTERLFHKIPLFQRPPPSPQSQQPFPRSPKIAAGSSGLQPRSTSRPIQRYVPPTLESDQRGRTQNREPTRPTGAVQQGRDRSASATGRGLAGIAKGVANIFRPRSRSQAPPRSASAQGWYDRSESQRGGMTNHPNSSFSGFVYIADPPAASGSRTSRPHPPHGEATTGDRKISQQSQRDPVVPVPPRRPERSANTGLPGPPPVPRRAGLDYAQMRPSNRTRHHTEQEASRRAQTSLEVPAGGNVSNARQGTHTVPSPNLVPRPLEAPLGPQRTVGTSSPGVRQGLPGSTLPAVTQVPPSPNRHRHAGSQSLPYSQNAPPIAHNASSGGPGPGIAGPSTSRAHHHSRSAMPGASGSRPSGEYTSNKQPRREHSRDRRY